MQFMLLRRGEAAAASDSAPHPAPAPAGAGPVHLSVALSVDLRPSRDGLRLRLSPEGEAVVHGPFPAQELVAGFSVFEAASKEAAIAALVATLAEADEADQTGDDAPTLELRETGCPGGCAPIPPAPPGDGGRYAILLRSTAMTETDDTPPRAVLDTLDAFNAAQAQAGRLLAGDGLKSTARAARVRRQGGQLSVIDGPFTEAKELIAGFWLIRAASLEDALAWARTVPYPTGPRVEVEIRPLAPPPAAPSSTLSAEQRRADDGLRAEQLDAALRGALAAPLAWR